MSDTYKPPEWQSPNPTGVTAPVSMQVEVKVPTGSSNAEQHVLVERAHSIVNESATGIDRFMTNNRQQISLTGTDYYDKSTKINDVLHARHRWNHGQEKLNLEVYPDGGGEKPNSKTDTNLDGFMVWIHAQPNYPNDVDRNGAQLPLGPWTILMNGYVLEDNWQPRQFFDENNAAYYAVMFGPTALLCTSLMDKDDKNFVIHNSGLKLPRKLIPPGFGKTKDGVSPSGVSQPARDDMFGYYMFDWLNANNPCSYIKGGNPNTGQPTNFRWDDPLFAQKVNVYADPNSPPHFGKKIVPMGGIYFPDTRKDKSPLEPRGGNTLGTAPAQGADALGWYTPCMDVFYGEFYDRGKYMSVVQSWTISPEPNTSLAANSKPILFGRLDNQAGYSTGNGSNIPFNLDPSYTKKTTAEGNDNNQYLLGPHDGLKANDGDSAGAGPGDVLTPDQQKVVEAWRKKNYNTMKPFLDQQAKDASDMSDQILQMTDDVRIAHDGAWYLRAAAKDPRAYTTGIYSAWLVDVKAYLKNPDDANQPNYDPATAQLRAPQNVSGLDGIIVTGTLYEYANDNGLKIVLNDKITSYEIVNFYLAIPHRQDYQKIQATAGIPNYDPNTLLFDVNMFNLANTNELNAHVQGDKVTLVESEDYYDTSGSGGIMHDAHSWTWKTLTGFPYDTNYNLYDNTYYKVFGPSAGGMDAINAQLTEFVVSTMTKYDDLKKQLQAIYDRTPPKLDPYPFTNGSIDKFKYSKFGPQFGYNQNP